MISGILSILGACFCWGLVFVIPSFITGFNSLEIALGRFFIYGLLSFSYVLIKKRHFFSKPYRIYWKRALLFAFCSTILCYTGTVINIKYAGPTLATLIFAMTPIAISLAGNWHKKEYSFKKLLFPLILMITGIILAKFQGLERSTSSSFSYIFGILAGLIGIGSWTWFAVANSDFLKNNKDLHFKDWTLMMGTFTFFLVLFISPLTLFFVEDPQKYISLSSDLQKFFTFSLLLGTVSTSLAFYLWNQGSKKVPISLTGQLMIFEIIFALCLIYIFNQTAPSLLELVGIVLMVSGVLIGFKTLHKPQVQDGISLE